jgi:hypothetical protein
VLVNPCAVNSEALATIPGTHILVETLGVVGTTFIDPTYPEREWTVQGLYLPIAGRSLGGIRARVMDQKGFISFCNQRDLEVLIEEAVPGTYCKWLGEEYLEPGDPRWFGLCVDVEDLIDDLFERELELRAQYPEGVQLNDGLTIERRVHNGKYDDYVELLMLLWDYDTEENFGPDPRLETVERRWKSVERTNGRERARLWSRL